MDKTNGINCGFNKIYDLILALHIAYIKKYPEMKNEFDFIEIPPIEYVDDICNMIDIDKYPGVIAFLEQYTDETVPIYIAIGMDDNYEFNLEKVNSDYINKYLGNTDIHEFSKLLKRLADDIKWDAFYEEHREFYNSLLKEFCVFPEELDLDDILDDINKFYGVVSKKYHFIPSVLMNGGFGPSDNLGNLYYVKGFQFNNAAKKFEFNLEYLLECMFHEFSHPFVNSIVDKFFDRFIIDEFYNEAIEFGLPKTYQNKKIFLYEYFVRANAYYLLKKYYTNAEVDDWSASMGFIHLEKLVDCVQHNIKYYHNYEELFDDVLIDFVNNLNYSKI